MREERGEESRDEKERRRQEKRGPQVPKRKFTAAAPATGVNQPLGPVAVTTFDAGHTSLVATAWLHQWTRSFK